MTRTAVSVQNRSGVRAICSDCHVPKDWGHKFVRKIMASKELYGKFIAGTNRYTGGIEKRNSNFPEEACGDNQATRASAVTVIRGMR